MDEVCGGGVIAYFYCDFARSEFQDARNLIGSLVAQLCTQIGCPRDLTEAFRNSNALGREQRPSWELLRQTLSSFSENQKILLLVDALDECDTRGDVLKLLSNVLDSSEQINILITSRDEYDMEDAFESFRSCSRVRMNNSRTEIDREYQNLYRISA